MRYFLLPLLSMYCTLTAEDPSPWVTELLEKGLCSLERVEEDRIYLSSHKVRIEEGRIYLEIRGGEFFFLPEIALEDGLLYIPLRSKTPQQFGVQYYCAKCGLAYHSPEPPSSCFNCGSREFVKVS